ncbi:DUF2235 domain-containing protein [Primorskyibacter sp. S187A]|uniref:DUF2235 domain-containing protein n=1 Tax=Primorskyibacter sp. S187A TaxID=3415130 RepID=UPI003C7DAC2F
MRQRLRNKGLYKWLRRQVWRRQRPHAPRRGPRSHVIILDGTMSSLRQGCETHAGMTYKLICEAGSDVSIYYEPGLQWTDWRATWSIMTGKGINRQIRRAYGYLASRYRPGDRIFLFGYSRGAYAVRSLAGLIDQVGLLEPRHATQRNIDMAYRHYQCAPHGTAATSFRTHLCHEATPIEMIGVWDTVKALGLRLPLLWRFSDPSHAFHNHALGASIKHGFHALAHDERRQAYAPVLWAVPAAHEGRVEQVWFPGNHGDVGGQIDGREQARPLANLSLVWLLGRAEACGLALPQGWRARFPADPQAPSMGRWVGWSKLFVLRKKRPVLQDRSERLHASVLARKSPVTIRARVSAIMSHR